MAIDSLIVVIAALAFLMFMAYKGHSVILFAPIAAMGAVLLTTPGLVAPLFFGLFITGWSDSSRATSRCSCWGRSSGNSWRSRALRDRS